MGIRLVSIAMVPVLFALSACSTPGRPRTREAPLLPGMSPEVPGASRSREPEEESYGGVPDLDSVEAEPVGMEEVDVEVHPERVPKKRQIPFEFNRRVAKWVQYFSQKDRERFQRFFDRGEPYREVIQNILEENGVPTDLYYLGMIESGFNAHAKSSAKAVGVWQFMRATGKLYGLRADHHIDERRDPIRATEAAARMLRDLNRQFKSWYLAMAAYNAGPGRIRRAIRKGGSHDFWELAERRILPVETMDYVPKFLAARYIGENPGLFGFFINEEKKYPDVELVRVPAPVRFSSIEKTCDLPEGVLEFVNPHHLAPQTHPGKKEDQIWVPAKYAKQVESKYRELASRRAQDRDQSILTVKRGDTLEKIARRHGLSVAYLKRVNGMRNSALSPGQTLRISAGSYRQRKTHPRGRSRI